MNSNPPRRFSILKGRRLTADPPSIMILVISNPLRYPEMKKGLLCLMSPGCK